MHSSQINIRVTERQRCRYLRNIHPPYDAKGKWRNKNDHRRKISRILKKAGVVKRAGTTWRTFLFLAVIFFVYLAHLNLQNQDRLQQSLQIKKWIKSDFEINRNLWFCGKSLNKTSTTLKFYNISDFRGWQHWFQTNWILKENAFTGAKSSLNCNTVVLNSIKIISYPASSVLAQCQNLPLSMQKILADTKHCNATFRNLTTSSSFVSNLDVLYVDLLKSELTETTQILAQNQLEAIEIHFVLYNKVNRVYSLTKLYSSFSNRWRKSQISVESAYLDENDSYLHLAINWFLIFWCICIGLSGFLNITEGFLWRKFLNQRSVVFDQKVVKFLDFFIWATIVSNIFLSSVFRKTITNAADCLEKAGHLVEDPVEVVETAVKTEYLTRQTLAFFSVLLVVKLLAILLNFHARRTSYNRALFALKLSMSHICVSWLLTVIGVVVMVALFFMIFMLLFYDVALIYDVVLAPFFHLWMTFFGLTKPIRDTRFTLFKQLNTSYKAPLFLFLLLVVRIFMKGILLASHRWYYHAVKALEHRSRKKQSRPHPKISGARAKPKFLKSLKKKQKSYGKIVHSSCFSHCSHVTFKQILQEDLKSLSCLIGYFPNFVNQRFAFMKSIAMQDEADEMLANGAPSAETNETNSNSFIGYDKNKLEHETYPYDISTHFDSFLRDNSEMNGKKSDEEPIKTFDFPDEDAFCEVRK